MPTVEKRTVGLPPEHAAIDRWLREEVAPAYDAMQANPTRGLPAGRVFDAICDRHEIRRRVRACTHHEGGCAGKGACKHAPYGPYPNSFKIPAVPGIRFRLASIRSRQRGPRDSASS